MSKQKDEKINIEVELKDGEKIKGELIRIPVEGINVMQGFSILTEEYGDLTILLDQHKRAIKV